MSRDTRRREGAVGESIFIRLSPVSHPRRLRSSWTHTFLKEHDEDAQVPNGCRLKPGDQVKVMYVEMGDKRIIKSVVKA